MKKFRLLSGILAFLMILSTFSILPVAAADKEDEEETNTINYMSEKFETADAKLETMTEMVTSADGRYSIYVEKYTGEIAYRDNIFGQTLFSNPYNINVVSNSSSEDIKNKLMSQVIVKYLDNDKESTYNSFKEAAQREQIKVKNIKNGVRIEYSIGREETRKLVPRQIEKSRFEEQILANITSEFQIKKMNAFYSLKDPDDPTLTDRGVKEMMATFPITQKMAVYVFDPYATDRELNLIESYILENCPLYTYDELDKDHEMTEYEGSNTAPALFKMALEYYLEDGTLRVRFPVNGLRFDDTAYQLTSIEILPYFGCGSYEFDGYLLLPDGSGTIVRFEDFAALSGKTVTGKVYGQDYAFYEISGEHQESVRMPVYGIVENYADVTTSIVSVPREPYTDLFGNLITDDTIFQVQKVYDYENKGFFAIIEEGEALASISTETGGRTCMYDNVKTTITPRQRDTYDIADAISGAGSAMWTVTSKRKYTGNYTLRFTMLNDPEYADKKGYNISGASYYETSYMGMVNACRDYMEEKGILTRLTKEDVKEDIPLYIESFGTAVTQEKILSFPVEVHTPLTTFEDLKSMTEQLNEQGIENINYRLTGYFNGGLWATIPYNVKVEENVGGEEGYKDFLSYASSKGIGVYPDFDFVWADAAENTIFDGLNRRQHLVKTMNTKYANMREYDPLYQQYMRSYMLAITPAYFEHFYDTFTQNFKALNPTGISVSTLGEYLNSDFDKKDPYNREDNKDYTVELLARIKEEYGDVMTDAGNYYALPYVDHILNVPLDSSEYLNTSETIPFMGMVLHGYVNFAGMAMNNAGDMNYQILKAIENGAGMYFQLSYQNTEKLKTNGDFSKYYSIDFDIWFEDLVAAYNRLNDAISDLQTKLIVDHEFVEAHRVLNEEEAAELEAEIERLKAEAAEKKAEEERLKQLEEEKKAAEEAFGKKDKENAEGEAAEDAKAEEEEAEEEEEEELEEEEEEVVIDMASRTLVDNGKTVRVEYEGGTVFFLNYNNFPVTVTVNDKGTEKTDDDDVRQVEALSFIRIN